MRAPPVARAPSRAAAQRVDAILHRPEAEPEALVLLAALGVTSADRRDRSVPGRCVPRSRSRRQATRVVGATLGTPAHPTATVDVAAATAPSKDTPSSAGRRVPSRPDGRGGRTRRRRRPPRRRPPRATRERDLGIRRRRTGASSPTFTRACDEVARERRGADHSCGVAELTRDDRHLGVGAPIPRDARRTRRAPGRGACPRARRAHRRRR